MKYLGKTTTEYLTRYRTKPTVISLFSGCGGFDIGTAAAGFETRVMIDNDKGACATLKCNWVDRPEDWREIRKKERAADRLKKEELGKKYIDFVHGTEHYWWQKRPPAILCADIRTLSSEAILEAAGLGCGEATLLTGGFPCQGFSTASSTRNQNKNDHTTDERNFLYKEAVRVISETLPKTFALENVAGLVSMENGAVVDMITKDLAACGYDVSWYKINCADYGVPQNRIRVFFIGNRVDLFTLADTEQGPRMGLCIAAVPGSINHPDWYIKKYGFQNRIRPEADLTNLSPEILEEMKRYNANTAAMF